MELESGADSVSSTPRSSHHHPNSSNNNLKFLEKETTSSSSSVVRLMCSFGGKIVPRPHDNQLRYVGGDTRIVALPRAAATFSLLVSKLSKLVPSLSGSFSVKYQLPNEDLDALITVSSDEDMDNMLDEFDRLAASLPGNNSKLPRLRLFLFPPNQSSGSVGDHNNSDIASLLDGSKKRESWFFDALNGGGGGGTLERGKSEASSIVSEVPDYLFGLDNSDDPVLKLRNRAGLGDDPGSPAFGSSSSAPPMPNLPPVKTKPEAPAEEVGEPVVQSSGGLGPVWVQGPAPGSPFPGHGHAHHHPMGPIPVYYVPGPNPGQQVQTVPVTVPGHYVHHHQQQQHYGAVPVPVGGPVPVGFPGSGPVYGGGGPVQPVYYGVNNAGVVGHYPGVVGDRAGLDGDKGH